MWKRRIFKFLKWFFGIIVGLVLLITLILYIFKDDIIDIVIAEANKHLNTEVKVSDVDLVFWGSFPNLSVDFNEVFIKDNFEGATNLDTLLYSERIRLKFNPMDMWRENYTLKSIEVGAGALKLKVREDSLVNYNILKESKEKSDEEFEVNLKSVQLKDFRFSYSNDVTNQLYETELNSMTLKGALSESSFTTQATSDLRIITARSGNINLISNQKAKLDIKLNANMDSSTVSIPLSTIYVANLPFTFKGDVDTAGYQFELHSKNISIRDVANNIALDQTKNVKKFSGSGDLIFDLTIDGTNESTSSADIECIFGVENGVLVDPNSKVSVNDLRLDGYYTNDGGNENERVELRDIKFKTKGGPFRGELAISKFDSPLVEGKAEGWLNLGFVNSIFSINSIKELSGSADLRADFEIQSIPNEMGAHEISIRKLKGDAIGHDVNLQLHNDQRLFRKINGRVYLRNDEAGLDEISLTVGKSDFKVNGAFTNIVDYFNKKGDLMANLDVASKFIQVADLGTSSKAEKASLVKEYILPKTIGGKVYLDVAKLSYEGHSFFGIKGNMKILSSRLDFPKISLRNAEALIRGSISIKEKLPELFQVRSNLASKNIDIGKMFIEWNNFEQTVITDKNISGKAKASVEFEAPFDLRTGIVASGIIAEVGIEVKDGKLKNVSSFKTITNSLRDSYLKPILGKENINEFEKKLLNLSFKTLKNDLIIRDGRITIPEMSIKSSALDVEMSGKHTFANKIDYHFGFRFRDLKKKQESEFGEIIDDGSGFRVFMRMYGDLLDPTIEWDKEARKAEAKVKREEAKRDRKSILKSEFGFYKNDTTVKAYIPDKRPKEELIIHFDPTKADTIVEETVPVKDGKLMKKIKELKKKTEAEKTIEFEIDQ